MPRPRRSRTNIKHEYEPQEEDELVRLWLLRMLVPLRGIDDFINRYDANHMLYKFLGLPPYDRNRNLEHGKEVLDRINQLYEDAEKRAACAKVPQILANNIATLAGITGLSSTDCRVLECAVLFNSDSILRGADCFLPDFTSSQQLTRILAVILSLPEKEVQHSLGKKGVLFLSGLLRCDIRHNSITNALDLISDSFAEDMLCQLDDPLVFLRDKIFLGRPSTLELSDFEHIAPSTRLLLPYLKHVLQAGRPGVNILLHGLPGTGKSELSRLLASECAVPLLKVSTEDEDGDPLGTDRRLRSYRAAQWLLSQQPALVVFDEAEDVFTADFLNMFAMLLGGGRRRSSFGSGNTQSRKGWFNRMLEENKTPAIWITNSGYSLDPALIRRFDMVIELPIPPKSQRERIVRQLCRDSPLPEPFISRLAAVEHLAPAVVSRALSVVSCLGESISQDEQPAAVELLINSTLTAQGEPMPRENPNERMASLYDPAYCCADADLHGLAEGLAASGCGRLCLYGPPGTGKTAWGHWLADKLKKPIEVKRASDLISMYVGQTEQNIAQAFHRAEQDGALLLIDEVDSFLRDRRGALHSWEVSGVNEMLVQMEQFPGVFIASTNLMQGLDQASLRRFDLKVCFRYLQPEQAWQLFERHCSALRMAPPESSLRQRLGKLTTLVPGDFATVCRQARFRSIESPEIFLALLTNECQLKEDGGKGRMGFL